MARGGWNLDIETRCMQEVVDAGKFGYCNSKNVRSGGEANRGSLRMKEIDCRKENNSSMSLRSDTYP